MPRIGLELQAGWPRASSIGIIKDLCCVFRQSWAASTVSVVTYVK